MGELRSDAPRVDASNTSATVQTAPQPRPCPPCPCCESQGSADTVGTVSCVLRRWASAEGAMGRRELLTEDERTLLFGVPVDEASLARHYALSADDSRRSICTCRPQSPHARSQLSCVDAPACSRHATQKNPAHPLCAS